jgi:hypothetical protein
MKAATGANAMRKNSRIGSFEIRDRGSSSARTRVTDIDANARTSVLRDGGATARPQHSYMGATAGPQLGHSGATRKLQKNELMDLGPVFS